MTEQTLKEVVRLSKQIDECKEILSYINTAQRMVFISGEIERRFNLDAESREHFEHFYNVRLQNLFDQLEKL